MQGLSHTKNVFRKKGFLNILVFMTIYLICGQVFGHGFLATLTPASLPKKEKISLKIPSLKPSPAKTLHFKANLQKSLPKAAPSTALHKNQFQIGAAISNHTAVFLTTSFKDPAEKFDPRIWVRQHSYKKNLIMPGIGFEWQPPEKLKVGQYQWKMPHKLSLSGELRADILKNDEAVNSFKNLPSRLRFNAVLFKVHYRLGSPKK